MMLGSPVFPFMNNSKDKVIDEDPVIEDYDESAANLSKSAPRNKMEKPNFI